MHSHYSHRQANSKCVYAYLICFKLLHRWGHCLSRGTCTVYTEIQHGLASCTCCLYMFINDNLTEFFDTQLFLTIHVSSAVQVKHSWLIKIHVGNWFYESAVLNIWSAGCECDVSHEYLKDTLHFYKLE